MKDTLDVISFNIWGNLVNGNHPFLRWSTAATHLEQMQPDIVLLQEVHSFVALKTFRRHLTSLPYIAYAPSVFGPRGGLAILSRVPLETIGFHRFPILQPNNPILTNLRYVILSAFKGMLVASAPEFNLTIITTHLSPNYDGDWSEASIAATGQSEQLRRLSNVIHSTQGSLLVAGDFNIPKNTPQYYSFTKLCQLVDVFGSNQEPTYHSDFLNRHKIAHCIDWMLVRGERRKIQRSQYLFNEKILTASQKIYLSDHVALRGVIKINEL